MFQENSCETPGRNPTLLNTVDHQKSGPSDSSELFPDKIIALFSYLCLIYLLYVYRHRVENPIYQKKDFFFFSRQFYAEIAANVYVIHSIM